MNPAAGPVLQLRDVHAPPVPGLWPPAPGWWVLAGLLLVLLAWAAMTLTRRYRLQRRRRRILQELESVGQSFDPERAPRFLMDVSTLLRRLAIDRYSRRRVASLTGRAWLEFLDETGGEGRFVQGEGEALAEGPYQNLTKLEPEPLLALARAWIEKNSGA
jgi:hypothetical protein